MRRLLRVRGPVLDCGLVACGLLVWLLTDFMYGDIGGPSTVLIAVGMGLVAWWALAGDGDAPAEVPRGGVRRPAEEALAR
jgi:hypothetical protein